MPHGETQTMAFESVVGHDAVLRGTEGGQMQEREVPLVEEVVGHLGGTRTPLERRQRAAHEPGIVVLGDLGQVHDRSIRSHPNQTEVIGHPMGRPAVGPGWDRDGLVNGWDGDAAPVSVEAVAVIRALERVADHAPGRQRGEPVRTPVG